MQMMNVTQTGPTNLCVPVACHCECQGHKIENTKYDLRKVDVVAFIRNLVQPLIDVNMERWVDKWACPAVYFAVVSLPGKILLHLLHVRFPVNFCILQQYQYLVFHAAG